MGTRGTRCHSRCSGSRTSPLSPAAAAARSGTTGTTGRSATTTASRTWTGCSARPQTCGRATQRCSALNNYGRARRALLSPCEAPSIGESTAMWATNGPRLTGAPMSCCTHLCSASRNGAQTICDGASTRTPSLIKRRPLVHNPCAQHCACPATAAVIARTLRRRGARAKRTKYHCAWVRSCIRLRAK